jgi:release factor glutamine methyltransferase
MGKTIKTLLAQATEQLTAAGCDAPQQDARTLLALAMEDTRHWTLLEIAMLQPTQRTRFETLVARRAAREPLAQIIGHKAFWSLDFFVNQHTLTPRADSEAVIEAALSCLPQRDFPYQLLDLGTGSGCLLLSLLQELPAATGLGVDRSSDALAVSCRNATQFGLENRVRFVQGNWADALRIKCDMIVSNPPYIPYGEIADLMPEVQQYEPLSALEGGADGLRDYRVLAAQIPPLLKNGGFAVLEIGINQSADVIPLMEQHGLHFIKTQYDLAGIARALVFALRYAQD